MHSFAFISKLEPLVLLLLIPTTLPFTPNIRINERMNNYPVYLKNAKWQQEKLAAAASASSIESVLPPNLSSVTPDAWNASSTLNHSNENLVKSAKFGDFSKLTNLLGNNPLASFFDSKTKFLSTLAGNDTSRFFSMDAATQSLNLGVSFTVPFLSLPMQSLITIGESTASALTNIMNVNWPSLVVMTVLIGAAALVIPKISGVLVSFLTQIGLPTDIFSVLKGNKHSIRAEDNFSSYTEYIRRMEVAPFTSILNQIDQAMQEYDLDSTSCMQRVVCTYVSEAEEAIDGGSEDPKNLILKGVTRSSWVQGLLGDNALTEALEVARKGIPCSKQFYKCPFSLPGIIKLLSKLALR